MRRRTRERKEGGGSKGKKPEPDSAQVTGLRKQLEAALVEYEALQDGEGDPDAPPPMTGEVKKGKKKKRKKGSGVKFGYVKVKGENFGLSLEEIFMRA